MLPINKISLLWRDPEGPKKQLLENVEGSTEKKNAELNRSTCGTGMPCNDK